MKPLTQADECASVYCDHGIYAKGMCKKHYYRHKRGNDINKKSQFEKSLEEKFWDNVKKTDDCWLWTASTSPAGWYGQVRHNNKKYQSNRLSYEIHFGEIPEGLSVLHKCDVPLCVNPDHLFLGTAADNLRDMDKKGRRNRKTKLYESDVRVIKDLLSCGTSNIAVAWLFDVTKGTLSHIKNSHTWENVT